MASLFPFTCFQTDFIAGIHDLEHDTYKLALTAGVYDPELDEYSAIPLNKTTWNSTDFPELFGSAAYPDGGYVLEKTNYVASGGSYSLYVKSLRFDCAESQFFGPFRYLVVYNHTKSNRLVGYYDYTVVKDLSSGETFFVNFHQEVLPAIKFAALSEAFIFVSQSAGTPDYSGQGLTCMDSLKVNLYGLGGDKTITFRTGLAGLLHYNYALVGSNPSELSMFGSISIDGVDLGLAIPDHRKIGNIAVTANQTVVLFFRGNSLVNFHAEMFIGAAVPAPTVTSILPAAGPIEGHTNITIKGTGFVGETTATVGGVAVTDIAVVNCTTITAKTAAHSVDIVSVLVTTPTGTNGANTLFTYAAVPTVSSLSPATGSTYGGTAITISGTNFTGATFVTIGGIAATDVIVVSSTTITAYTYAHAAGSASVLVTTAGGTNAANTLFTYETPS